MRAGYRPYFLARVCSIYLHVFDGHDMIQPVF